jgi:hypothetical protein
MELLNSDFLEKIILKGMISDRNFLTLMSSVYEPVYFDDPVVANVFTFCKEYIEQYHRVPSKEAIINSQRDIDEVREVIENAEQLDFNLADSYEFLLEQTNEYLKSKAINQAIVDSIEDVQNPESRNIIQKRIENAIIKDIKIDLGLNYFEDMGIRLRKIFTAREQRIPPIIHLLTNLSMVDFHP